MEEQWEINLGGFEEIVRFIVPPEVLSETLGFLRYAGGQGCEGLALWVGILKGNEAEIRRSLIPKQIAVRSRHGLSVHMDGEALHELNVWLHQNRMRLFAQVHSHGEGAYHSETDDEHSVVTTMGALSIVIPHFAAEPFSFESSAILRLTPSGWVELTRREAEGILVLR